MVQAEAAPALKLLSFGRLAAVSHARARPGLEPGPHLHAPHLPSAAEYLTARLTYSRSAMRC